MKTMTNPSLPWPPEDIQLLVDDELPESRRARLLEDIDLHQGWRDVAFAFLEEQEFRRAAKTILAHSSEVVPLAPTAVIRPRFPVKNTGSRDASLRSWTPVLAATLLLSFTIGWLTPHPGSGRTLVQKPVVPVPEPGSMTVRNDVSPASADQPGTPTGPTFDPYMGFDMPTAVASASPDEVQLTFTMPDGWMSPAVQVQVVEGIPVSELPSWEDPVELPEDLKTLLAKQGRQVQQRSQWIPVNLADGRQGLMPIRDLILTAGDDAPRESLR